MINKEKISITGLIISAGLSGRMGAFKPLLTYDKLSFIQNVVIKLSAVCNDIVIVTGFNAQKIEENLKLIDEFGKCRFVYNPDYNKSMYLSLKTGLSECNTEWILYHFVDQPGLPKNFYIDFVKEINNSFNWIQPAVNGVKGHPILFDYIIRKMILSDEQFTNLRDVSKSESIKKKIWGCNYKEILQDIDTLEQYKKLV